MRRAVALLAGLIVVASSSQAWAKVSGQLDQSFGTHGKVLTDFSGGGSDDSAFALAIQSDGKIVAAGRSIAANATKGDFAVARYNSDGTLDTTFGAGGTVLTDFSSTGSDDVATAVAIQSDGR